MDKDKVSFTGAAGLRSAKKRGGGYCSKKLKLLAAFLSIFLPVVFIHAESPMSAATAGRFTTDQDAVTNKLNLRNIDFAHAFAYAEYSRQTVDLGTAFKITDAVNMGVAFAGDFLLGQFKTQSGANLGSNYITGQNNSITPSNTLSATLNFPKLPFNMGVTIGFGLGGTLRTGDFTFTEGSSSGSEFNGTFSERGDQSGSFESGYINQLSYTPSVSYKISIPLAGGYIISPDATASVALTQNDAYTKYTTSSDPTKAEQKQLSFSVRQDINADLTLPAIVFANWGEASILSGREITHSVSTGAGAHYDFATKRRLDYTVNGKRTEVEVKPDRGLGVDFNARYSQTLPLSDRVRLAWQARIDLAWERDIWPTAAQSSAGVPTASGGTGWQQQGAPDTMTRNSGGTWLRTGNNGRIYETVVDDIAIWPTLRMGIQWDAVPGRLTLNAGAAVETFRVGWNRLETRVVETLDNVTGDDLSAESTQVQAETPLARFSTGFTFYILRRLILDTSASYSMARRESDSFSISNVWSNAILKIALSATL